MAEAPENPSVPSAWAEALDRVPTAIAVVNPATQRALYANEATWQLLKVERRPLEEVDYTAFLADYQRDVALKRNAAAHESGSASWQRHMIRGDGSQIPVRLDAVALEIDGVPVTLYAIVDLSLRVEPQEAVGVLLEAVALLNGPEFFGKLAESLADATGLPTVVIARHLDEAHAQSVAIYHRGAPRRGMTWALAGTPCEDTRTESLCLHQVDVQAAFPEDDALAEFGATAYLGIPLMNGGGDVVGHIAMLDDKPIIDWEPTVALVRSIAPVATAEIERMRAEDQAVLMEQQLRHAQKMESLGVLAGGIAHDFNNLLTSIIGNVELAADTLTDREGADNLVTARESAQRAADLCRQLLAYAGQGTQDKSPVDLSNLVADIAPLLQVSSLRSGQLHLEPGPESVVTADRSQLTQIVMNLMTNAADAVRATGGTIRVATGVRAFSAEELDAFTFGVPVAPGPLAFLEVEDDGQGMEEAVLERMFDPFFTTKQQGTGLGLSAVLGIISSHSGALRVTSAVGSGTRFCIVFPLSAGAEEALARTDGPQPVSLADLRVLVVDDDDAVRGATSALLRNATTEVLAADGANAAERLFVEDGAVTAMVCDLSMPGRDGIDLHRSIRRRAPDLPIVLMSGFTGSGLPADVMDDRTTFLPKPFTRADLLEALSGLL